MNIFKRFSEWRAERRAKKILDRLPISCCGCTRRANNDGSYVGQKTSVLTDYNLKAVRRSMEEERKKINDHIFDTVPLEGFYSNYAIRTDEGVQQ